MIETLYLGLRTADGIDGRLFAETYGLGLEEAFPEAVAQLGHHLRQTGNRWFLPPDSWLLYDHLIGYFL